MYGQDQDKHYETVHASESELLELHAHKTGALIIAGVDLGCDAAQADAVPALVSRGVVARHALLLRDAVHVPEEAPVGGLHLGAFGRAFYFMMCEIFN